METKICHKCGIEFERPRYADGKLQCSRDWEIRKYCGLKCAGVAQRSIGPKRDKRSDPEYGSYESMHSRCRQPNRNSFHNYGGRGIKVCDRWSGRGGYRRFLADMGRKPSPTMQIDRIDNNGDYCPENCRWATTQEQGLNKRTNKRVEFRGRMRLVIELAKEFKINRNTVLKRLRSGWSLERAILLPVKTRR